MIITLIPCGPSDWHSEGRLLGRVELAFTPQAEAWVSAWVERLRPLNLSRILHAPDELARATARLLGRRLGVPTRTVQDLKEVDLGLWAGLTDLQLRTRYASAYRQLQEAPLSVCPPGGEEFAAAAERLRKFVQRLVRRNGRGGVGVVLRPVSLAIARYVLNGLDAARIWEDAWGQDEPVVVEYGAEAPAPGP